MSLFTRPAARQAKLYIQGLEEKDLQIKADDKLKGTIKVTVGEDGSLLINNKAITFLRNLMVTLPNSLVNYGYPHTLMVEKGETLSVKPSLLLLLEDSEHEDFIGLLAGEHEMVIREFKTLTR